jgi:hypothetical protein
MKNARLGFYVGLIALALGFSACQKNNSGGSASGSSALGVRIQAFNKSFSMPVSAAGMKSAALVNDSITWDSARMVVSSVNFNAILKKLKSHRDSMSISYKWNGPTEINLMDSVITVGNFTLQPGFYDEIELRVDGFKQDAGTKPVFYLHGIYSKSDTAKVPVVVRVNEDIMFKTEKDSVEITAGDPVFSSVIQLYLDQLMTEIQVSALNHATLTNGTIVISASSNKEIYRIIMRNLGKNHHARHFKGRMMNDRH